jgi:iron(III) transport system substrate-binding protein
MRRAIGRRAIGALAAVLVVLTVAACGGSDPHSLVLYNGQHPQLTDALVSAFEKQTGVHVSVRTNDGIVLADQLLQEGNASAADVYITENSPELVDLDEHHLLARLNPATLDQTPARFRTPTGDWIGMALRVSGLAYDPARISASQLPVSVLDLAQPQWKGKIAIAPTDSDFPPVVGAVIARYGTKAATDWLAGLKRNAQLYASDEAVVAAVNRGDVATGVINHYYWYRLRLEIGAKAIHSAVYYFPSHNVGSIENVAGAAVLRSSSHKALARKFVNFLVSREGQEILARGDDFEYPARPGVSPNPQLQPLARLAPAVVGPTALGNDQEAAQLIQQSGLA